MFPKRSAVKGPKRLISWRCPDALLVWIRGIVSAGYRLGDVITELVSLAKDVTEGLESEWSKIEATARRENKSTGAIVAELARRGMAAPNGDDRSSK